MKKEKLINDILSEWSMRSHDGLASGYNNADNLGILRSLLEEKKFSNEVVIDIVSDMINFDPKLNFKK